jgi:uncharacterized protein YdgA (DUF945 family)
MKKIVIIMLILAVVIGGAPYIVGSNVESQFRTQVNTINSNPSFTINISEYNKGWFTSTATLELDLTLPPEMAAFVAKNQVKINQKIQHGPILWQGNGLGIGLMDAEVEIELPAELKQEMQKVAAFQEKLLTITSRTGFDLSTRTQIKLKPFSVNQDGTKLDVLPAQGEFYYTMEGKIEGAMNWQGMKAEKSETQAFTLGEINLDTKQQLVMGEMFKPSALFNGYANFSIAQLAVTSDNPAEAMAMTNLNLKATSKVETGLMKVSSDFSIEAIEAIQQRFEHIQFNLALNNLDTQVLQQMNQILSDNQSADPMAMAAQLQGVLPQLIAKGPELHITKLGMQTHAGLINTDMQLSFDQEVYDPANPMTMILALDADAQGFAPEAFFSGFGLDANINDMVANNFLKRDQSNLTFKFSFKQGQALLNGNPMPLGM